MLRSAGVAFGGGAALVGAATILLLLDWAVRRLRAARAAWRSPVLYGAIALGTVATLAGLYFALGGARPYWAPPLAPPILLAVGSVTALRWLLLAHAERADASLSRRATLATLVSAALVGVFWATTLYAENVGRETAVVADQFPERLPLVTVFSNEFLDLPADSAAPSRIAVADEAVRYRYGGLRLLTFSNDRWFLISGRHDPTYKSSVTVLRDSDTLHVEIADQR